MNRTKKLAYSAILCALSVAVMYIGTLLQVLDLCAVAIASFLIMFADFELRLPYNLMVYLGTSIISFVLLPNKGTALLYIMFFGFYPIVKRYTAKIRLRVMSYSARILIFLFLFTAGLMLVYRFFMDAEYELLFKYLWLAYPIALALFLLYDYVIEVMASWYYGSFRNRIKNLLK